MRSTVQRRPDYAANPDAFAKREKSSASQAVVTAMMVDKGHEPSASRRRIACRPK